MKSLRRVLLSAVVFLGIATLPLRAACDSWCTIGYESGSIGWCCGGGMCGGVVYNEAGHPVGWVLIMDESLCD